MPAETTLTCQSCGHANTRPLPYSMVEPDACDGCGVSLRARDHVAGVGKMIPAGDSGSDGVRPSDYRLGLERAAHECEWMARGYAAYLMQPLLDAGKRIRDIPDNPADEPHCRRRDGAAPSQARTPPPTAGVDAGLVAAWQRVSDALDGIPGGMHADLEDAASGMWTALDRLTPSQPGSGEGWQPIETAPKDGTLFDVWVPDYLGGYRVPGLSMSSKGRLSAVHNLARWPTHWRPLPAASSIRTQEAGDE